MKRTIIIILSALVAFSTSAVAAEASVSSVSAQQPKKAKAELKDVTFKVNLHCQSCKKKLEENISERCQGTVYLHGGSDRFHQI